MAARLTVLGQFSRTFGNILSSKFLISERCRIKTIHTTAKLLDVMSVKMPSLSPTMYEGTIVQWLKKEGETISAGELLCEIQTDKAVVGFEMEEDAILAKILVDDSSKTIKIGTPIALLVEEGDDWQNVAIPADITPPDVSTEQAVSSTDQQDDQNKHKTDQPGLGPAVRTLLHMYSINPRDVAPSGPQNRLLKGDILQYIKQKKLSAAAVTSPPPPIPQATPSQRPPPASPSPLTTQQTPPPSKPQPRLTGSHKPPTHKPPPAPPEETEYVDIELTGMRKVIATRLTESKTSTPHAYSTIDSNIGQLIQLRKDLLAGGVKVSVNDFIIKAVAISLQRVPEVNAQWSEDGIQLQSNIDISVAVATESGLITPIVKDVIGLGVEEISNCVREMAGRAKEGRLKPEEYQGGTFTISNLGMFGVTEFTAVINPPQACIMAVGTSRLELGLDGTPQTVMNVTISSDARVINEHLATRFLEAFKETMENPMLMLSQKPKIDMKRLFAK